MTLVSTDAVRSRVTSQTRALRVAHVNANFLTGSGGIMLREALAVDPARYATTIIAPEGGTLFEQAERAGVCVLRLKRMGGGRHVYPWADAEALRGRAGALGRLAARRVGVPALVHTLHGFPFNDYQSPPTRTLLRAVERRLGRITDWFLTDGTFVAAEAIRLQIAPPDRIRALVSPTDAVPPATAATRRRARRLLGVPDDVAVIGTTGRLVRQKGPLDMVDAIAALSRPDVRMVWVGDGAMRRETERRIARHGLGDRFLLIGDRDDVPQLLPAFDVLAMSSLWEGLPCSVLEAMSCGIPVVATAVNSVPEVVIPGRTGLLARPDDPGSLARALAFMLDHPEAAARMAAAARAQVADQFLPELLGAELMDVYAGALRHATGRVSSEASR
jgi:glycosyltransferase involved in cell wall biosynthesis